MEDYAAAGLMVVMNDPVDNLATLINYLENPTVGDVDKLDLFHFYYDGTPYGDYWYDMGYDYGVPYAVVIDRDGYFRLFDDPTPIWPQVIEQCLGVYTP